MFQAKCVTALSGQLTVDVVYDVVTATDNGLVVADDNGVFGVLPFSYFVREVA